MKTGCQDLEKGELPWKQNFFIATGVLPVELLAYQVSMVSHLLQKGPLHDPVSWYGTNYAETQVTQWDFQKKEKSTL